MPSIQEFFRWGLDRKIPDLIEPPAYRGGSGHLHTAAQAMFLHDTEGGQEIPWLNLGPGDRKVVEHVYVDSYGRKISKKTIGVGPPDNKLTDKAWVASWCDVRHSDAMEMNPCHDQPHLYEALPFDDNSVGAVHMHQFLEHFEGDMAIAILREVERVLVPGGVAFITVPYQGSSHWGQALDHKSTWNEETWDWLFNNEYYSTSKPWSLRVHACFIMGIVIRNLDLFTQLVKE